MSDRPQTPEGGDTLAGDPTAEALAMSRIVRDQHGCCGHIQWAGGGERVCVQRNPCPDHSAIRTDSEGRTSDTVAYWKAAYLEARKELADRSPAPEAVEALREALRSWESPETENHGASPALRAMANRVAECARDLLAALSAPPAEPAWEPFETAPTDGTEIIAYRPDAGVLTVLHCLPEPEDEYEEGRDEIWFTARGEDIQNDLPTHWMPLPAPPETTDDE